MEFPREYLDLVYEQLTFAQVATVMADGTPQVTPVWYDYDGEYLRINSARGRVKDQNMSERPHVAVNIMDSQNPYRYVQIRGRVVEITEDGAYEHILDLAEKYRGKRQFPLAEGEVRRMYKIAIESVDANG